MSAGRFCFSRIHRFVHGRRQESGGACWAIRMWWAARGGRSALGRDRRRVCGGARTAEISLERPNLFVHDWCAPPSARVCLVVQRRWMAVSQDMCGAPDMSMLGPGWADAAFPSARDTGECAERSRNWSRCSVVWRVVRYVFRSRADHISGPFESSEVGDLGRFGHPRQMF